jgi:hypothetical protein
MLFQQHGLAKLEVNAVSADHFTGRSFFHLLEPMFGIRLSEAFENSTRLRRPSCPPFPGMNFDGWPNGWIDSAKECEDKLTAISNSSTSLSGA